MAENHGALEAGQLLRGRKESAESVAGLCRRLEVSASAAGRILNCANPRETRA